MINEKPRVSAGFFFEFYHWLDSLDQVQHKFSAMENFATQYAIENLF